MPTFFIEPKCFRWVIDLDSISEGSQDAERFRILRASYDRMAARTSSESVHFGILNCYHYGQYADFVSVRSAPGFMAWHHGRIRRPGYPLARPLPAFDGCYLPEAAA